LSLAKIQSLDFLFAKTATKSKYFERGTKPH